MKNDAAFVIPSREDNASPARTEGSHNRNMNAQPGVSVPMSTGDVLRLRSG
jgi:hypothetical protein